MAGAGRQPWGWHRLRDGWAERVVTASGVRPGELVVDLGAGDGALTAALLARGATVLAVERHPARVRALRTRFTASPVRVVACDLESFVLPHRPFRVVANPPYALMAATLRRLTARNSPLVAADVVLPASFVAQVVGSSRIFGPITGRGTTG